MSQASGADAESARRRFVSELTALRAATGLPLTQISEWIWNRHGRRVAVSTISEWFRPDPRVPRDDANFLLVIECLHREVSPEWTSADKRRWNADKRRWQLLRRAAYHEPRAHLKPDTVTPASDAADVSDGRPSLTEAVTSDFPARRVAGETSESASAEVDETPLLLPMPRGALLAQYALDLFSSIDSAFTGHDNDGDPAVSKVMDEIVASVTAPKTPLGRQMRNRLHEVGLQAAVLLEWLPQHRLALAHWTRDDRYGCAALLPKLRSRLAEAIHSGRFAVPDPRAASLIAAAILDRPEDAFATHLADKAPAPRSTSKQWEFYREVHERTRPTHPVRDRATLEPSTSASAADTRREEHARAARAVKVKCRADFYGRDQLVSRISQGIEKADSGVVVWLSGRHGVGKSELAAQVANTLSSRYDVLPPLDMNLLRPRLEESDNDDDVEHRARQRQITARRGATLLLKAAGEPVEATLTDNRALFARLRATLSRGRYLLLLDNALDSDEVAPLIEAADDAVVLVTSHQRTQPFARHEFAVHVPELKRADSAKLLEAVNPWLRPSDRVELERIADFCDNLPLALHLVAAMLTGYDRPSVVATIGTLSTTLASEALRLDVFGKGEDNAIRRIVLLSYANLTPSQREAFQFMSLAKVFAAPHFSFALNHGDAARTELTLHSLVEASLGESHSRVDARDGSHRAFQLHELIRLFAGERLRRHESPERIEEFERRLAEYMNDRLEEVTGHSNRADHSLAVDPTPAHRALDLATRHGWWDVADSLCARLCTIYLETGDLDATNDAIELTVDALLHHRRVRLAVETILERIAHLNVDEQACRMALRWAHRAREIALEHELVEGYYRSVLEITRITTDLGEYETAYISMSDAERWLSQRGEDIGLFPIVINLARLTLHLRDTKLVANGPSANSYARQAVEVARRRNDTTALAIAHFEMGRTTEECDDAVVHYTLSGNFYIELMQFNNAAVAAQNRAGVLASGGQVENACAAQVEAVENWRRQGAEPARFATALIELARYRFVLGHRHAVERLLSEAADISLPGSDKLAYEILVRLAVLRRLEGATTVISVESPADIDESVETAAAAVTKLALRSADRDRLTALLSHAPLHGPTPYDLWVVTHRLGLNAASLAKYR